MKKQSLPRWVTLAIGAVVAAVLYLPVPVLAHHGWGGYGDTNVQISGTVETPVSTSGPHATLRIRDTQGNVWDVVLAPPARTMNAGLKEGIIPVGAQVTAHGHRHRDAKKFEIKTERLSWNGKTFNVYPDRD